MSELVLPTFKVDIQANATAEVVLAGVYSSRQSLARPVPHYKAQGPLSVRMGIDKGHEELGDHQHLVRMAVAAELVQPDGTVVLRAEVNLEGVAVCLALDEEQLAFQLQRALPARLFAHARVHIENLTRDSGYRPLTLPPVPLDPAEQPGVAAS